MSEGIPEESDLAKLPPEQPPVDVESTVLHEVLLDPAIVESPVHIEPLDASYPPQIPTPNTMKDTWHPSLPNAKDATAEQEPTKQPIVDQSNTRGDTGLPSKNSPEKLRFLEGLSIDEERGTKYKLSGNVEVLERRFNNIASYSGLDAHKIARAIPLVLGYREETFDERIKMLEDLGLNASKIANRRPQVLTNAPETVADRFAKLAKRGLDAKNIFENAPGVIQLSDDKIDAVLGFLKDHGVEDPVRAVNDSPTLVPLSLDPERIDSMPNKVKNLEDLGLDVALILNRRPKILTGKIETIQKNVETICSIASAFGLNGIEVAHSHPSLIDYNAENMELAARLALASNRSMATPEDLGKALQSKITEMFLRAAGQTHTSKGTSAEKRTRVYESLMDPKARDKAGAFATLNYTNALPEDQKREVLNSIKEQGDIRTFDLEQIDSKQDISQLPNGIEDYIATRLEEFTDILRENPPSEAYLARFGLEKVRAKDLYDAAKIVVDPTASVISTKMAATFLEDVKTGRAALWQ